MALAIIGGEPARFAPFAQLFRRAAAAAGHDPAPPLSINSHGFIADSSDEAAEIAYPPMKLMMDRIGRERGWPPTDRAQFEASRELHGASFVGDPSQVIEKILHQHEIFDHDRFLIQFTIGSRALAAGPIRVRMGLHTGSPHLTDEGYVDADVHRAARERRRTLHCGVAISTLAPCPVRERLQSDI